MKKPKIALAVGAGKESIFAIKEARKQGFFVIAFDANSQALGLKYANEAHILDIKKPEFIIKALKGRIPKIILPTPIGSCLTSIGALNDHFKLKGCSYKAALYCADKFLFHQKLNAHKLRNISSLLISSDGGGLLNSKNLNALETKEKLNFTQNLNKLNFPLILKPRFGSGNRGVVAVFSKDELEGHLQIPFKEDYLLENLVPGKEYGIDGAVINGCFKLVLVREKILTAYPYTQCVGYYALSKFKLYKQISAHISRLTRLLKIKNSLIHCDLKINKKGEIFTIELAPRASGHNLHSAFIIYATGINLIKEYLNFAQNKPYNFKPKKIKKLAMRFFNFENCKIKKVPNFEKLKSKYQILDYQCNLSSKTLEVVKEGKTLLERGYFIIKDKNKKHLEKNSNKILSLFEKENLKEKK